MWLLVCCFFLWTAAARTDSDVSVEKKTYHDGTPLLEDIAENEQRAYRKGENEEENFSEDEFDKIEKELLSEQQAEKETNNIQDKDNEDEFIDHLGLDENEKDSEESMIDEDENDEENDDQLEQNEDTTFHNESDEQETDANEDTTFPQIENQNFEENVDTNDDDDDDGENYLEELNNEMDSEIANEEEQENQLAMAHQSSSDGKYEDPIEREKRRWGRNGGGRSSGGFRGGGRSSGGFRVGGRMSGGFRVGGRISGGFRVGGRISGGFRGGSRISGGFGRGFRRGGFKGPLRRSLNIRRFTSPIRRSIRHVGKYVRNLSPVRVRVNRNYRRVAVPTIRRYIKQQYRKHISTPIRKVIRNYRLTNHIRVPSQRKVKVNSLYQKLVQKYRNYKNNKVVKNFINKNKSWWDKNKYVIAKNLDKIQTGLDFAGLIPGVGIVPDGINAFLHAIRGNKEGFLVSVGAMIPVVGEAAILGKYGIKGTQAIGKYSHLSVDSLVKGAVIDKTYPRGGKIIHEGKTTMSLKEAFAAFKNTVLPESIKKPTAGVRIGTTADGRTITIRTKGGHGPTIEIKETNTVTNKIRIEG